MLLKRFVVAALLLLVVPFVAPRVRAADEVPVRTWTGHTTMVYSVAFSPDGKSLVSASLGGRDSDNHVVPGTVKVWDAASGNEKFQLDGFPDQVTQTMFSRDGKSVITVNSRFDPDNPTQKATGVFKWFGELKLWDAQSGQPIRTMTDYVTRTDRFALSPDGKTVVTHGGYDFTLNVWDLAAGNLRHRIDVPQKNPWVVDVAFSPDGKTIVSTGGYDHTIHFWDAQNGTLLRTIKDTTYFICQLAFSPDGKLLATSNDRGPKEPLRGQVKLWNVESGKVERTLDGFHWVSHALLFSPDGTLLAVDSPTAQGNDVPHQIKLYDTRTWALRATLEGHKQEIDSLAFSPDGKTLASGSRDKTVKLWDVSELK